MATLTLSITLSTSAPSYPNNNLTTSDTLQVTATSTTAGLTITASVLALSPVTVTVSPTSAASGTVFTITPNGTTGNYSVLFQASSKSGTETASVSGTVTSSVQNPDLNVSVGDFVVGTAATSATRVLSNATNGENYRAIMTYNGTATSSTIVDTITNYNSTTNTTFSFGSNDLPSEGRTAWYKVQAQRPTSASPPGDGTWQDTNISGTSSLWIRKQNSLPSFTISDNDAASATVGILATVTNNSSDTPNSVRFRPYLNGSALQGETSVAWTGNGLYNTGLTQPRDISAGNYTYTCRVFMNNDGSSTTAVPNDQPSNSSSTSTIYDSPAYDPGFKQPETSISVSAPDIAIGASTHSVTISNNNDGITRYRVRSGSYTGTVVSNTITGNGTDSSVTGGAGTYYITGYIPTTSGGDGADDNITSYTVSEVAPNESGVISGGTTATEGGSGLPLTFTISNATTNVYNWRITRNSGTAETGGEISSSTSGTFTGSSGSTTVTFHNNTIVETGFQGESFTMTLRTGGTIGSGTILDTHTFTLYDNDAGITANNVNILQSDTSHTASFTVATGGGSISARIKDSGGTVRKTFTLVSSGADTEVVSHVPSGSSGTYSIEVYNGNAWIAGDTYTVTVLAPTYTVTAPASIDEGSSGNVTVTTTNFGSGTLYWTVSPSGDFNTASGDVTITSNSGNFNLFPSSDTTTEGAEVATISLRTGSTSGTVVDTDTFIINDTSTGGGGGSGVPSSDATHGLAVYGEDGTKKVLSPTTRFTTVLTDSTFTLQPSGQSGDNILLQADMTGLSSANSALIIVGSGGVWTTTLSYAIESGGWRVTNTSTTSSITARAIGVRF